MIGIKGSVEVNMFKYIENSFRTKAIIASSSGDALEAYINKSSPSATVEAEYGDQLVSGSYATLAHHGKQVGQKCPCLYDNFPPLKGLMVGISHLDIDTLGGVLALVGVKPHAPKFWVLAAFVDEQGAHRIRANGADERTIAQIWAMWAWLESHPITITEEVTSVTSSVINATKTLCQILAGDEDLLSAGNAFQAEEAKNNLAAFVRSSSTGGKTVILRESEGFVNHLYVTPAGTQGDWVVAYNPADTSVTISMRETIPGFSCIELVQTLWGPLAGGHVGIAGSPRNRKMCLKDADELMELVISKL